MNFHGPRVVFIHTNLKVTNGLTNVPDTLYISILTVLKRRLHSLCSSLLKRVAILEDFIACFSVLFHCGDRCF